MRFDYQAASPGAMKAMMGLENYLATQSKSEAGVEKGLLELVKIRVSQINRCAFCLDMHTKDARALGETEQRIYALNAWHEAPFFSDKKTGVDRHPSFLPIIAIKQALFADLGPAILPGRRPGCGNHTLHPLRFFRWRLWCCHALTA